MEKNVYILHGDGVEGTVGIGFLEDKYRFIDAYFEKLASSGIKAPNEVFVVFGIPEKTHFFRLDAFKNVFTSRVHDYSSDQLLRYVKSNFSSDGEPIYNPVVVTESRLIEIVSEEIEKVGYNPII